MPLIKLPQRNWICQVCICCGDQNALNKVLRESHLEEFDLRGVIGDLIPSMMGPLPMIVREVEGATRAVCWHFKFVMNGFIKGGRGATPLAMGSLSSSTSIPSAQSSVICSSSPGQPRTLGTTSWSVAWLPTSGSGRGTWAIG